MTNKTYIGDSVYAEMDGLGRTILTTNNGEGDSNTIILEPEVFVSLVYWHRQWLKKLTENDLEA